jgi:hypothetical protein
VTRARGAALGGKGALEPLLRQALAGVVEDPELVRFLFSQRVGAIPAFRAAVRRELVVVRDAAAEALRSDLPKEGPVPTAVSDAVVVLLLEACEELLDGGPERLPEVHERLLFQVRALVSGLEVTR